MANLNMQVVTRLCKHCSASFTFLKRRGSASLYCSKPCVDSATMQRFKERHANTMCHIEGCKSRAKNIGRLLCSRHESLWIRTGKYTKKERSERWVHERGYIVLKRSDHPMASKRSGWAYEHRVVLFDALGDGSHPCHWCGSVLEWRSIVVDHLNENKSDNRRENLVPSCSPCNRARGALVPFIKAMNEPGLARFVAIIPLMRAS